MRTRFLWFKPCAIGLKARPLRSPRGLFGALLHETGTVPRSKSFGLHVNNLLYRNHNCDHSKCCSVIFVFFTWSSVVIYPFVVRVGNRKENELKSNQHRSFDHGARNRNYLLFKRLVEPWVWANVQCIKRCFLMNYFYSRPLGRAATVFRQTSTPCASRSANFLAFSAFLRSGEWVGDEFAEKNY